MLSPLSSLEREEGRRAVRESEFSGNHRLHVNKETVASGLQPPPHSHTALTPPSLSKRSPPHSVVSLTPPASPAALPPTTAPPSAEVIGPLFLSPLRHSRSFPLLSRDLGISAYRHDKQPSQQRRLEAEYPGEYGQEPSETRPEICAGAVGSELVEFNSDAVQEDDPIPQTPEQLFDGQHTKNGPAMPSTASNPTIRIPSVVAYESSASYHMPLTPTKHAPKSPYPRPEPSQNHHHHPRRNSHSHKSPAGTRICPAAITRVFRIPRATLKFCALCAMWYASSALTNTTGKQILNQFKYPVTLTYVQFGFVAGLCFLSSLLNLTPMAKGGASTSDSSGHMKLRPPSWTLVKSVSPMAAFQIFGHVFSSLAISRVPVSFAHTIKALSPLFTVALYRLFYNINYPLKVYLALMPLTFGVMLVCISELTFNVFGFLCALTSTLIFVVQNMYTKDLFVASAVQKADPLPTTTASTQSPDFQPLDKLNLLFYSSGLAFLGMFPLWLSSDASSVIHLLSAASPPPPTTHPQAASGHPLLILFILNGLTHFFQNIIAFHLLSLVSPVTYSVASLVKRIFVICASIVWFGQHVDARQGLGIAITFLGLWIYQGAKRTVEEKDAVIHPTNAATNAAARRRRKILLLPK